MSKNKYKKKQQIILKNNVKMLRYFYHRLRLMALKSFYSSFNRSELENLQIENTFICMLKNEKDEGDSDM